MPNGIRSAVEVVPPMPLAPKAEPAAAATPKAMMDGTPESPCRHHEEILASHAHLHRKLDAIGKMLGLCGDDCHWNGDAQQIS